MGCLAVQHQVSAIQDSQVLEVSKGISIRRTCSTCSLAVEVGVWAVTALEVLMVGPLPQSCYEGHHLCAVFTFGGPGGFQARYGGQPRRRAAQTADEGASPFMALLPMFILFAFAIISIIPSLFSSAGDPDPKYTFAPSEAQNTPRSTWNRQISYWVNQPEWEQSAIWQSVPENKRSDNEAAKFSSKLRSFERNVEGVYIRALQNQVSRRKWRKGQS